MSDTITTTPSSDEHAPPGPIRLTVERTIDAPPTVIWALITDVERMPEWSPEVTESSWLGTATGATVGARFVGRNRAGSLSWSTKPRVTEVVEDRVFEFRVPAPSRSTWRYELTPVADGTRVVESVHQSRTLPFFIRLLQRRAGVTDRRRDVETGMHTTLDRLAAMAEQA